MKIVITVHTYIFVLDGKIVKQDIFDEDKYALEEAERMTEEKGKKVLVARWLEEGDK